MLTSIFALALLGQCAGGSCALPARAYQPATPYQPLAPAIYQSVPAYRPFYAPAPVYIRPRGAFGRLFRR
ncbi:hypothetical protein [Singulisphaera acidiphila]|uniref:Uncharacterized protein n=1 Tax=Singulisphaera acidiphila (strain ATCC BAA-1392 / DSM 18658 / VKM B-2454 / MOB10) TaxID=886293 RepID=L0DGB5_SINAD|nr:hypothetical protein [Singulisphaera acidiphila]AGA28404.1 hypothetical protein Sinac_4200 [Singulisphaera acidiphila DSM 18658]